MPDDSTSSPSSEVKPTKIELGMNWDTGMVLVQSMVPGQKEAVRIEIPIDAYVSSAVALGQQLLQRMQANKPASKILAPHPGQVPGDLRRH